MFSSWSSQPKQQAAPESRSMATQTSRRASSSSQKSIAKKDSRRASISSSCSSASNASLASVNWQRDVFNRTNSTASIDSFKWKPSSYYVSSVKRKELDFELELEIYLHHDSLRIKKNGDWQTFQHGTDQFMRTLNPRYIAESLGIRNKHVRIEIKYTGPQSPLEPLLLATSDSMLFLNELERLGSNLSRGKGSLDGYRRSSGEHYGIGRKNRTLGRTFTDRAHVTLDFQANGYYTRSRSENLVLSDCQDLDCTFSLSQAVTFSDPEWDRREPEIYSELLSGYCFQNGSSELHREKMIHRANTDQAAGPKLIASAKRAGFVAGDGGMFFSVRRSAKDGSPPKEKSVAGLDAAKLAFARRVGLVNDHKGHQADSSFTWWARGIP